IGSTEKANSINACLDHLCDSEVIAETSTFDGAEFTLTDIKHFFKARLLVHTEIMTSSGANCISIDLTKIIFVTSRTKKNKSYHLNVYVDMLCAELNTY
ncbi:hypothetical protein ACI65C_012504, partial [Semiaphis heraclei]